MSIVTYRCQYIFNQQTQKSHHFKDDKKSKKQLAYKISGRKATVLSLD